MDLIPQIGQNRHDEVTTGSKPYHATGVMDKKAIYI